jgi:hypothetical protein
MFLTDVVIPSLNEEIRRLQREALDAVSRDDKKACQDALRAQEKAIASLISVIQANEVKHK